MWGGCVRGTHGEGVEPRCFSAPGKAFVEAAHRVQEVSVLLVDGLAARVELERAPELDFGPRPVRLEVEADEAERRVGFSEIRIELERPRHRGPCFSQC